MADDGEKHKPRRLRLPRPGAAWFVVLVALTGLGLLAAGFLLKASRTRDSLVLRNHRALSRIAEGANVVLDGEAFRLASLLRDEATRAAGKAQIAEAIRAGIAERAGKSPRDRDLYESLGVTLGGDASCPGQPLPTNVEVRGARLCSSYTVEPDGRALRVRVLFATVDAATSGAIESVELSRPIPLDRLFREGTASAVFEKFVAADGAGNVLFDLGERAATLSNLEQAVPADDPGTDAKPTLPGLRASTGARKIDLGGRSYWLFTRPLRGVSSPGAADAAGTAIVLGGLTSVRRLNTDSLRIFPTLLLYIALFGLAAFLSVPLLKLVSIGPYDRLRATDGLRVVLCTVFASGLLAIAAADIHEYVRLRRTVDDSLERLASEVRARLRAELLDARATALRYAPAPQACVEDPRHCGPGDVFWRHGEVDRPETGEALKIGRKELFAGSGGSSVLEDFPYPFFTALFLTDAEGEQFEKFSVRRLNTRWTSVARRAYFRDLGDHPYRLRLDDGTVADYRLEPIFSFTDGRRETILSVRRPADAPGRERLPFAYLAIRLLSLYDAVLPEGFGFAIVDREGNVLYHADERRNLAENLVTECDGDRWLTAALRAASGRTGDVTYMGAGHRVHVVPVEGTPWALVTFFDKQILRSMNVEASTLAVAMFVLLFVACLALVAFAALLDFPGLTRRFWMDPDAFREYRWALALLAAIAVAFLTALVGGFGHRLFWLSFAVPLSCLVGTFLLLTPGRLRHRIPSPVARALGAAILLACLVGTIATAVRFGRSTSPVWWVAWLAAIAVVVWGAGRAKRAAFLALASSLIIVVGVLSALGFFKAAFEHESELMVRSQQIDLVRQLDERKRAAVKFLEDDFPAGKATIGDRRLALSVRGEEAHDIYARFWMATELTESTRSACAERDRAPQVARETPFGEFVHELFRRIRPYYGRVTVENADLFVDDVPGRSWSWTSMHEDTIRLIDCSQRYAGIDDAGAGFGVTMSSSLPLLRSSPPLSWIVPVVLLAALVVGTTRLMLSRLTLLYQDPPRGVRPRALSDQLLGRATLVLGAGADTVDRVVAERGLHRLDLHGEWTPERVASAIPRDVTVTVEDLDGLLDDHAHHARMLDLLDLLLGSGRRVVLFGRRHPNDGFPWNLESEQGEHVPDAALRPRWGDIWLRFDVVTVRDAGHDDLTPEGLAAPTPATWLPHEIAVSNAVRARIVRECRHTAPLHKIGRAVAGAAAISGDDAGADDAAVERAVLDDIFERASGHYAEIWRRCARSEQRVLHQIATTGLVNWRNALVLRRLVRMGLVRWDANLALFNTTFSRYVSEYVDGAALYELGTGETPSVWHLVRIPLIVTLMVVAAVMFTTQPDLFGSAVAVATAVAGSIPLVLRLLAALQASGTERSS